MAPMTTAEHTSAAGELAGDGWASTILPARTLASRHWDHALARRCREPARVMGFIEPASTAVHIVAPLNVGFTFEARELGTGRWLKHRVAPGELCVVGAGSAPSELCWQSASDARTLDVVELYIDPEVLTTQGGRLPLSVAPAWCVMRDPLLKELVGEIGRGLARPDSAEDLFGELATTLLAVQLARLQGFSAGPTSPKRGGLAPLAVERVRHYVASHLASRIPLSRLAALAGLSTFHFSRAFKISTGLSPSAYLLHHRINEAKRLLATSTLPLAEIARRTGFGAPGPFSTRFRASTGSTPSAFRALCRR